MLEVARSDDLDKFFKLYHDSAAHPGINATIKSIRQRLFWTRLNKDVTQYVS